MTALMPNGPPDRLRSVATAIAQVATTTNDAAVLVTIDYFETGFERRGIPFGLVSWRHRIAGRPLAECAQAALDMLRRARRCSDDVELYLGWYHTGRCEADSYSRRQAVVYAQSRAIIARRH